MPKQMLEGVPTGNRPNQPKQFRFPDRKIGSLQVVSKKFMKDMYCRVQ